jgi:hypothetical protein
VSRSNPALRTARKPRDLKAAAKEAKYESRKVHAAIRIQILPSDSSHGFSFRICIVNSCFLFLYHSNTPAAALRSVEGIAQNREENEMGDIWAENPLGKGVTREALAAISDDQLYESFLCYLDQRFREGGGPARVLAQLPPGLRALHYLSLLVGEIYNGGFNQYFFNQQFSDDPDEEARLQAEALKRMGAVKHVRIFEKAQEMREAERANEKLESLREEGTLESLADSYELTGMDELDEEWCGLETEFCGLWAKFVRENTELFITG